MKYWVYMPTVIHALPPSPSSAPHFFFVCLFILYVCKLFLHLEIINYFFKDNSMINFNSLSIKLKTLIKNYWSIWYFSWSKILFYLNIAFIPIPRSLCLSKASLLFFFFIFLCIKSTIIETWKYNLTENVLTCY